MKLTLTEKSFRTEFVDELRRRLSSTDELLVVEEGSYEEPNGRSIKIPDVVVVSKDHALFTSDSVIIRSNGVRAVLETKKPKREASEGSGQALQYAVDLNCKLAFTTNFKQVWVFHIGDKPAIGHKSIAEEASTQATKEAVDYVVGVLEGKEILVPTDKSESEVIGMLKGAVSEVLTYLQDVDPATLKNPLGIITETMDVRERPKDEKELDNPDVLIRQASAYLIVNQILFYNVLSSYIKDFPKLRSVSRMEELQKYFDRVLIKDYEAVFSAKVSPFLPDRASDSINSIINAIVLLKLEQIKQDLLGKIFHELIPFELRKRLAAYYTSSPAAEFLARLAITNPSTKVLDPSCGSGTLLVAAYHTMRDLARKQLPPGQLHRKLLKQIYGVDVTLFAAHLAVIHLSLEEPLTETEKVLVINEDAFELKPDQVVQFLLSSDSLHARVTADRAVKEEFKIPSVDVVIQNPPFTRSKRLNFSFRSRNGQPFATYKEFLEKAMRHQYKYFRKGMGLHCYFILHADDFLGDGGVYAAVLPSSTFITDYGEGIKKLLLTKYHIEYFVTYRAKETFSEGCTFKEVLLVARKGATENGWGTKFVTLKKELSLDNFLEFAEKVKLAKTDLDDDSMTIVKVSKKDLERQWNWLLFTKSASLRQIVSDLLDNLLVKRGRTVFVPKEGLHVYEPEFFFIPNEQWSIVSKSIHDITIKHNESGELVKIPNELLKPALRKPELYNIMSPKLEHYVLLIPPTNIHPDGVKRYIEIGEINQHHKGAWIAKYCRLKKIPWYSYAYDDQRRRQSGGHLILLAKFRMRRRPCIAHFSEEEATGSNNYYFGSTGDLENDKVLAGWFNSTVFLALFLALKREIAGDWSQWKIADLTKYPVLDPRMLSEESRAEIIRAVDSMADKDLPAIPKQLRKTPRKELDFAILKALKMKNIPISLDNLYYAVESELSRL